MVSHLQEFIALPKLPAKMRQAGQVNFPACFDQKIWVTDAELEIVANVAISLWFWRPMKLLSVH